MNRYSFIYCGQVRLRKDASIKIVSAAISKRRAGELMELWLDENDPNRIEFESFGVASGIEPDFIDLKRDRPLEPIPKPEINTMVEGIGQDSEWYSRGLSGGDRHE